MSLVSPFFVTRCIVLNQIAYNVTALSPVTYDRHRQRMLFVRPHSHHIITRRCSQSSTNCVEEVVKCSIDVKKTFI